MAGTGQTEGIRRVKEGGKNVENGLKVSSEGGWCGKPAEVC